MKMKDFIICKNTELNYGYLSFFKSKDELLRSFQHSLKYNNLDQKVTLKDLDGLSISCVKSNKIYEIEIVVLETLIKNVFKSYYKDMEIIGEILNEVSPRFKIGISKKDAALKYKLDQKYIYDNSIIVLDHHFGGDRYKLYVWNDRLKKAVETNG